MTYVSKCDWTLQNQKKLTQIETDYYYLLYCSYAYSYFRFVVAASYVIQFQFETIFVYNPGKLVMATIYKIYLIDYRMLLSN